jgi:hypothetical protein
MKKELYGYVRNAGVIRWHINNKKPLGPDERVVNISQRAIADFLENCWDFEDVPLRYINPLMPGAFSSGEAGRFFKKYLSRKVRTSLEVFHELLRQQRRFSDGPLRKRVIACHYVEGIDPSRRNDLNWYKNSSAKPEDILIYFDEVSVIVSGRAACAGVIRQIEAMGFKWVALKKGVTENLDDKHYWAPPALPPGWLVNRKAINPVERWIIDSGNDLLRKVHYWSSFHTAFNIGIHHTPEEATVQNIAQAIAFDIDRDRPGLLVGKQRSELYMPSSFFVGYYPKHVFFLWNRRIADYFKPNHNRIDRFIVAGYPNDVLQGFKDKTADLRARGAKFVIALLDSGHGPETEYSSAAMAGFYKTFLEWAIKDQEIGLVIKPKKPEFVDSLHSIRPLLEESLRTSRAIMVENTRGRLPSEASIGADISVGIGISSAVLETVITGRRGVLYDKLRLSGHEFYKWGREKVIFDNLERMCRAIKDYKENPVDKPELGDWSAHIGDVDAFCDGKGGERMGRYMSWLLEGLKSGKNRDDALRHADRLYSEQWGEDKIIKIGEVYEAA